MLLFGASRRWLLNRSKFTFVVFEYIANVSLISVCRAQLHTIMISPCWARRVGGEHWQRITTSILWLHKIPI